MNNKIALIFDIVQNGRNDLPHLKSDFIDVFYFPGPFTTVGDSLVFIIGIIT